MQTRLVSSDTSKNPKARKERNNTPTTPNVVKDVKISFGFKREEQLTNQANFMGEVYLSVDGERKEHRANQANVIRDADKINVPIDT